MSQVTNLAFFRARRGHSEALGTAVAALVEPTRLEAGCLNYCRAVLKRGKSLRTRTGQYTI
jgi:quinol monooxygenase YgiN